MRVATYNLGDGSDDAKRADLLYLATVADVICLQEAGDRTDVLRGWAKAHGWRLWLGNVPGSASVPILYKAMLVPTHRFSRVAVPRMYVGAGAGPSWAKAKAVVGLRFGNRVVLNTHMVASATRTGRRYRLRRLHYRLHMSVLAAIIRRRVRKGLEVVSVGDYNAEPGFALLDPLRKVGMRQHVTGDTHGTRLIDLIWTHGIRGVAVRVFRGMSSDHHAVVAEL